MTCSRTTSAVGPADGRGRSQDRSAQGKCKIHLVDLKGTYTGDNDKGAQENQRLLAAVVENVDGPWYFKLVAPRTPWAPGRKSSSRC